MAVSAGVTDVGPMIQLAIAPVFLLTAVGTLLGVHTTRLGRAVDRTRMLQERQTAATEEAAGANVRELKVLRRRMRLIYLSITLEVVCALFVGLTIVTAFADALVDVNLSRLIQSFFVLAMIAFLASLMVFLREIFLAVRVQYET